MKITISNRIFTRVENFERTLNEEKKSIFVVEIFVESTFHPKIRDFSSISIAVRVKTEGSRSWAGRRSLSARFQVTPYSRTREASAVIDGVIYRITRYTYARPPLFVREGYYPAITRREMEIMSFRFDGTSTGLSCKPPRVTFAEFMHGTDTIPRHYAEMHK